MHKPLLLSSFFTILAIASFAQLTPEYKKSTPAATVFALKVDYGNTVVHTPAVRPIGGAHPIGFGFEISKQAKDSATYHLCSAYPRMGLQLEYFHYGTPILGNSFMAAYFVQPVYRVNNFLSFHFRATIGFCYSDNPFDPNSPIDTLNQNFSLHINPYLQLGGGWGLRLSKHISLELNGALNHISNGNIKRPNRGLNWITGAATVVYSPEGSILPKYHRVHDKYWKGRPIDYRLGLLYVAKQDYAGATMGYQRTYATGGFVEAAKQIGRIHGLVAGLQVYYNNLLVDPPIPGFSIDPNKHSSTLAGLYIGHEFLLGRVIISQVIGRYLTTHPAFYNDYFHQHSFRYLINKHWQPGFCFRAHSDEADFIGLNVLYQF
ncbi:acyloxyacyl hydrolase [Parasediminibacterium sp. JCM 36343]|uniref:acyloxyacyl hydrolase n=1 Tax=Parasediminibacterium sp. JCM 36343 TaxID=3374279 RepID=UPI00397A1E9D